MRIYFDTETTGVPDRRFPWHHPAQPRIVSIAWCFVGGGDDWTVIDEQHRLIFPDGWEIDESGPAFAAHRITTARCQAEGVPLSDALAQFSHEATWERVSQICAYNISFDIDMTQIECEKLSRPWLNFPPRLDILPLAQAACQIPPTDRMKAARRFGFKPPKLSEALKILCSEDFPEAHDALADVRATIKIHRKLMEIANGTETLG